MLNRLSDPADDANPVAARKRVINRVVDELDWVIWKFKQDTDDGKAWLCRRTVKTPLTARLREYRANIVFGLMRKDVAIDALGTYLRHNPLSEYKSGCFVQNWQCAGSHVIWTFYNRQQYRLKVEEVARILLLDFEPFPAPLSLMSACLMRINEDLEDALKIDSERIRTAAIVEGLVLVRAALLLTASQNGGPIYAEDKKPDPVAQKH